MCVFSLSLFSFLFQGKDIARFYDITCHMTLQHVCSVCMHYSHVFVCVYVFLCMSVRVCLSVQPLAAIAGTGSCASLCAKYIWSVSYFEFKLKNFLASFASALLCCVCERQMPYTHTGHTMYVYVRVCVLFCEVIIKTICTFSCCVARVIVVCVQVVAVVVCMLCRCPVVNFRIFHRHL